MLKKNISRILAQLISIAIDCFLTGRILRQFKKKQQGVSPHSTDYFVLGEIFQGEYAGVKILDVGSGYGRAAIFFAKKKMSVTAIEIDSNLIKFSGQFLSRHQIEIIEGDVLDYKKTVEIIYMFNPLPAAMLEKFIQKYIDGDFGLSSAIIFHGNENKEIFINDKRLNVKKTKSNWRVNKWRNVEWLCVKVAS